ncbi:chromosome partitioning protein ParA [[Phormidium ambiguum] IAM M-71]|uniref:Chromosome partitioning protein ParA n=1 Tax=[Phormidium ambiguum] IAM M-71 TaxID=454136 RepID=A0A1U7IJE5_9CYAN|nr:ROK family protein [Phormidium ambiguum]OKH37266.1 chromosome partitioning protein ParA [Phormidium ambiguum IAM M-71]
MSEQNGSVTTLSIDIGGSGIKAMVLSADGTPLTERNRVDTPKPAKPEPVIEAIAQIAASKGNFDRVSVGFPGVVRNGVIGTAANLDRDWINFDLRTTLEEKLGKPVRVANDADIQGLGAISGQGVELVITLGTGFGSALFVDGKLVPNLELGHHQFRKGETYEQELGRASYDKIGKRRWNSRLEKAIAALEYTFNYDYLYIGGGNANKITFELPPNVKTVPNVSGILGGIALWRE